MTATRPQMIPDTPENHARVREVAERLQGTTRDLDTELAAEFGDGIDMMLLALPLLRTLDEITMLCSCCGWWCETHEFNSDADQICDDCNND